jgi:PAS domain-containing protein
MSQLVDRLPQQVWTARPDGALSYVNGAVVEYFARPAETIVDNGWQSVVHPTDLTACLEAWTRSLRTGEPYEIQFRLPRSDGT